MRVLSIDPGSSRSALVGLDAPWPYGARPGSVPTIVERLLAPNPDVLEAIAKLAHAFDALAIEWIESYGMPVGAEVFETCRWVGWFEHEWWIRAGMTTEAQARRITRRAVKLSLCGSSRAKDANVRAALLDLYGGREATRKGGALAGIRKDMWSALAVGIVAMQQQESD